MILGFFSNDLLHKTINRRILKSGQRLSRASLLTDGRDCLGPLNGEMKWAF